MTIICYRDGVMAADSWTSSDGIWIGKVQKICQNDFGALGASAGSGAFCERFRQWFLDGRLNPLPEADEGEFHALIVEPDGRIFEIGHKGIAVPVLGPWVATGAAWKFATGAMAAGATAEMAVQLCIEHCQEIRGPIQTERLRQ